jgi:hypothetical protein
MNCPKCGFARPLADQVCRRCKYVFDEGRFLALAPPRAKGGREPGRFFNRRTGIYIGDLASMTWLPPVASLIPGLGHVIQRRPWVGVLYFVLVALFGGLSLRLFSQTTGQMFFGLAVSTHASCILDTTPWARSPGLAPRMMAMGAILAGLVALYWPLAIHLSERFVVAVQREVDRPRWRPIQALSIDQIVIMAVLFVATIVVSAWLGRKLSAKES